MSDNPEFEASQIVTVSSVYLCQLCFFLASVLALEVTFSVGLS